MWTSAQNPTAHNSAATGEHLVAMLAGQQWPEFAACLDAAVQFRALIPSGLRTADEHASAAAYFQKWFGDADQLILMNSQGRQMHDRLYITYRFPAHEDQWYIVEQQAYCIVRDGLIQRIDLLCSGFRPEATDITQ